MAGKRRNVKIDWELVDKLCYMQCTRAEISSLLNISYHTLIRACKREKKMNYETYAAQKGLGGLVALRRAQFNAAVNGNIVMMIWLGKQYLGQRDNNEPKPVYNPEVNAIAIDEFKKRIAEADEAKKDTPLTVVPSPPQGLLSA